MTVRNSSVFILSADDFQIDRSGKDWPRIITSDLKLEFVSVYICKICTSCTCSDCRKVAGKQRAHGPRRGERKWLRDLNIPKIKDNTDLRAELYGSWGEMYTHKNSRA